MGGSYQALQHIKKVASMFVVMRGTYSRDLRLLVGTSGSVESTGTDRKVSTVIKAAFIVVQARMKDYWVCIGHHVQVTYLQSET